MRKALLSLLLLTLLLPAAGCSRQQSADDRILELREQLSTATQQFSAAVTADYGDRVYSFLLRFDSAAQTIDVLEPESIAGIQVAVSEGGTLLRYDGAELNTGALTADGLSPVAALPAIVDQWKEGYLQEAYYETYEGIHCVVMATALSDTVQHRTWFERETGIPVKAELLSDGFAVITCLFEGGPLYPTSQ